MIRLHLLQCVAANGLMSDLAKVFVPLIVIIRYAKILSIVIKENTTVGGIPVHTTRLHH